MFEYVNKCDDDFKEGRKLNEKAQLLGDTFDSVQVCS